MGVQGELLYNARGLRYGAHNLLACCAQSGFPLWSSVHSHRDDVTFVLIDGQREIVITGSFDRDIRCWDLRVCVHVVAIVAIAALSLLVSLVE